jgi:hypothetical protein
MRGAIDATTPANRQRNIADFEVLIQQARAYDIPADVVRYAEYMLAGARAVQAAQEIARQGLATNDPNEIAHAADRLDGDIRAARYRKLGPDVEREIEHLQAKLRVRIEVPIEMPYLNPIVFPDAPAVEAPEPPAPAPEPPDDYERQATRIMDLAMAADARPQERAGAVLRIKKIIKKARKKGASEATIANLVRMQEQVNTRFRGGKAHEPPPPPPQDPLIAAIPQAAAAMAARREAAALRGAVPHPPPQAQGGGA